MNKSEGFLFRKNNLKYFLSADGRKVDFKPYCPFKILHILKKLIIKRDLSVVKLAPFSLSNICLLFLEVKAIIDDKLKFFYSPLSPHFPKITHFYFESSIPWCFLFKIKMSKNISSKHLLFSLPVTISNIFHLPLATKTSSFLLPENRYTTYSFLI